MQDSTKCKGDIEIIIQNLETGNVEVRTQKNVVLNLGKASIAAALGNFLTGNFNSYITNIVLGDNGLDNSGNPLVVTADRTGLFGPVLISLPCFASISGNVGQVLTLTSTLSSSQANGSQITELGLLLANGNLYSAATTGGVSKDSSKQIIFNWTLSFI